MHLDSEQKRVIKGAMGGAIGFAVTYPLMMWIAGRISSWTDLLIYSGFPLIVALILAAFYALGSKIPKKDN